MAQGFLLFHVLMQGLSLVLAATVRNASPPPNVTRITPTAGVPLLSPVPSFSSNLESPPIDPLDNVPPSTPGYASTAYGTRPVGWTALDERRLQRATSGWRPSQAAPLFPPCAASDPPAAAGTDPAPAPLCPDPLDLARLFQPCVDWSSYPGKPDWAACCSALMAGLGPADLDSFDSEIGFPDYSVGGAEAGTGTPDAAAASQRNLRGCLCRPTPYCLVHMLLLDVPLVLLKCGLRTTRLIAAQQTTGLAQPGLFGFGSTPSPPSPFKCGDLITLASQGRAGVAGGAAGSAWGMGPGDVLEAATLFASQSPENLVMPGDNEMAFEALRRPFSSSWGQAPSEGGAFQGSDAGDAMKAQTDGG